ncbi:MAG: hypothetical protein ACKVS9_02265 [Phycisphaerae bacterium]
MNIKCRFDLSRAFGGLLCVGALLAASGCATLAGRWSGDDLKPEMARDQFKLLRPTEQSGRLVSVELRLQDDGSYTAELNYDGRIEQSLGTWKVDDNGYLSFVDKDGKSYGYAIRRPNGDTLEMLKGIKGTDATLTLIKQR